tara:strand:- start:337 stop:447 length:111 start_codon:yes stop_codon:yes gene_type:complete
MVANGEKKKIKSMTREHFMNNKEHELFRFGFIVKNT